MSIAREMVKGVFTIISEVVGNEKRGIQEAHKVIVRSPWGKDVDFCFDNGGHHAGCGLPAAGNMAESRRERHGSCGGNKYFDVNRSDRTL
jgi:hypothetical protein